MRQYGRSSCRSLTGLGLLLSLRNFCATSADCSAGYSETQNVICATFWGREEMDVGRGPLGGVVPLSDRKEAQETASALYIG